MLNDFDLLIGIVNLLDDRSHSLGGILGSLVSSKGTADYAKVMGLMSKPVSKPASKATEKEYPVPLVPVVRGNKWAGKRTVFECRGRSVRMFSLTENK